MGSLRKKSHFHRLPAPPHLLPHHFSIEAERVVCLFFLFQVLIIFLLLGPSVWFEWWQSMKLARPRRAVPAAVCLLPACSLGNMTLMSALSNGICARLCGVLLDCFFWNLSYCRGIVLQHCKHLGLESHRPHTNFIVILLFSKQKPKFCFQDSIP